MLSLLNHKISDGYMIVDDVDILLNNMEHFILGTLETLQTKGVQKIRDDIAIVWSVINQTLFTINKTPINVFKLVLSLAIFIGGFFLGNFYKKYIKSLNTKRKSINASTHTLIINIGYYTIFIITFFIVLKVMGIDLSSITLIAGALSVGIGFGLQNIISNFVSGIILMFEHSVKIGDYIEFDENLRGHVVDIKMRSLTINTNSNIDIIVPNQDLIQNRVVNWTMNDNIRRFEIPFGVAYGTNPQKVIQVILDAVENHNADDLYNTTERHTRVIMTGMGNSSVDFELFVWIKGKEILFPKRTTSRFLILIYDTLYENDIEIPFPQQDIHIRSISKTLTENEQL
jgi:small-conductance mechanosensitive channel